ncbi:hypothetical protein E2C01_022454 [Portunus trituberculatus]|uniref:Transposase Tc1-like domain-containing protein n=1 Tax=Portunus trituberculatus TaxID=210409 RepID=A0A5B7E5D8_PORTR|nr:hypothetical protein [Portunus trituberculatus]
MGNQRKRKKNKITKLQEHVSVRSVQDILHNNLGYKYYCALKKPLLTALQKEKRVKFSKKCLVWNEDQWKTVLWSDEVAFTITETQSSPVYCKPGIHLQVCESPSITHGLGLLYILWCW